MSLPQTPSFRLDGKHALVTGGTSGIGLGCAAALAQAGAEVTIAARNSGNLAKTEIMFNVEGFTIRTIPLDVSDIDSVADLIDRSKPFDILVNSAGLARNRPALDTTPEDFDAVIGLNVKGAYFLTLSVAKKLIAAGRAGSLINISSQMAHVGGIDRSVYCATKHGVEGMTKAMAIEWGPSGIRVNTICPTFIRTPLTEPTFQNPDRVKWIEDKIKLGRVGKVEDIMGATVFLAADASALITGTSILVDGGWTAG